MGGTLAARRWFGDHHAYSPQDLDDLRALAKDKGAELLLTTEKDWVKVVQLPNASATGIEILRIDVELRFLDDGEDPAVGANANGVTEVIHSGNEVRMRRIWMLAIVAILLWCGGCRWT